MIILEVEFVAWGPFSGRRIDLSRGERGLHLVFGPNEAGKSSALRGLRALFFGVPGHTMDAFAHDNAALRIRARLRSESGEVLSFFRRKGNKNTLLADDGKTPLPEDSLRPFLGAVTAELFAAHFAMGYEDLVAGGREILAGQGDVGRSLFSAAVGGSRLRDVIEALDREAAELFAGRGQNPAVNQALRELEELRRAVRTAALSVDDWRRRRDALDHALAEREAVGERLAGTRVELKRLEQLRDALPKLDELRAHRRLLEALGEVVPLPPEFGEERRLAVETRDRAEAERAEEEREIADRDLELASLAPEDALLQAGDRIDALHEALGSHRKAAKDRTGILQRKLFAEKAAADLIRELDPALDFQAIEQYRPTLAMRTRVDELKTEGAKREAEMKAAAERLGDAEAALASVEREHSSLPPQRDLAPLSSAVEAALTDGQMMDLAKLHRDAETIEAQAGREIDRLGLWHGLLDAAERLPVPDEETFAGFDVRFVAIGRERERLESEKSRCEGIIAVAEGQLAQLVEAGGVPSEDDLSACRRRREQLWELVRRAWLDGQDVQEEAKATAAEPLPQAYKGSVTAADEVADRLRREAERVAAQAAALGRREEAKHLIKVTTDREKQLSARETDTQAEWRSIWSPAGVEPRSPAEMRAFAAAIASLRALGERLGDVQRQITDVKQRLAAHCAELQAALRSVGETDVPDDFMLLLRSARNVMAAIGKTEQRRDELVRNAEEFRTQRNKADRIVEKARKSSVGWETALRDATRELPLRPDATVLEAVAVLEQLGKIFGKLDEAENEAVRLRGIDEDAARFCADAAGIAAKIAPDMAEFSAEDIAERLHTRRVEARERAVLRKQTEQRRTKSVERRNSAGARVSAAQEKILALCEQARCDDVEQLVIAADRSDEARRISDRISQIVSDLARLGMTVPEAEAEAERVDRVQLEARIAGAEREIADDQQRDRDLSEQIGNDRTALRMYDAEARAARAAEEEQAVLARLRTDVARYIDLRLAARILRHEIERYRAARQDPLLSRASEIFIRFTRGSFARLEADFDERDNPVLVGVRPTGEHVRVEGMSDGTRDQLHLALRLAHVEAQARAAGPLPLILDDLLVGFDDGRTAAALTVLAEVSDLTQVLLFTHHERVRDLAVEAGGNRVFVHNL